jgi:hypothetical protein
MEKKLGGRINSSFLALIPKENNPSYFASFMFISLCNASYKIITKILENRLIHLLRILISKNQGGFVKHKKIIDNIIFIQRTFTPVDPKIRKEFLYKLIWPMPLIESRELSTLNFFKNLDLNPNSLVGSEAALANPRYFPW